MNIARDHLENPEFNLIKWYGTELLKIDLQESQAILSRTKYQHRIDKDNTKYEPGPKGKAPLGNLDLASVQVDQNKYLDLQRNAVSVERDTRILHKPAVPRVKINGHPERALPVDTGSLRDLRMSSIVLLWL